MFDGAQGEDVGSAGGIDGVIQGVDGTPPSGADCASHHQICSTAAQRDPGPQPAQGALDGGDCRELPAAWGACGALTTPAPRVNSVGAPRDTGIPVFVRPRRFA